MPRYRSVLEVSTVVQSMALLFPATSRTFGEYPPSAPAKKLASAEGKRGPELKLAMMDNEELLKSRPDGNFVDFTILTFESIDSSIYSCKFFKGTSQVTPIANSTKAFVVMHDGYLRIGGQHPLIAHCSAALFAGEVIFRADGTVDRWSNISGTYMAETKIPINHAMGIVPFPPSRFYNGGFMSPAQRTAGLANA